MADEIKKSTADLPPEEAYAVQVMRERGKVLHPDIHGGPLLYCEEQPVCTWGTVFCLMGRGICHYFPDTKRYGLVEEWR